MKNIFGRIITAVIMACVLIITGCNNILDYDVTEAEGKNARFLRGWEEFNQNEIIEAQLEEYPGAQENAQPNAQPDAQQAQADKFKMPYVIVFDGALTKISQIGAKKMTANMESDAGVAFINFTENVLSGALRFADGFLDHYSFGVYKALSTVLFPEKTTPNPQIEQLQQSVNKIQDSVDEVKIQLSNLSDDLKYEFDGQKVSNRIQEIERKKTAFEKMFNYLDYCNQDVNDIDLMSYYGLKQYAIEAFGTVDKMRQAIQNFYTDYYKGNTVATRSYGESYRLIGEELFPWRYQTADFMETLIGQELDCATKLFVIAGIMLDPNDNENLLYDMMIQETMTNSVDSERLEKLVRMDASAGENEDEAVISEIKQILGKYWGTSEERTDAQRIRWELFQRERNVATDAWNNLANAFQEYEQTIEAIQVPLDNENEITCNIRGVRCTFSRTINQFNYADLLSKLAEYSVSEKTEANWLKLFKTGRLPSEKPDGYVRMLTADDYAKILDYYKKNNLTVTDSALCNIYSEEGELNGRCKKEGGNCQEATLFNIFRYDAGFNFQKAGEDNAKFACLNTKEKMGFIVENERTDLGMEGPWWDLQWCFVKTFDGLHFWNVKVPCVKADQTTLVTANELLLEDMAARKGQKEKISRINYYSDSKVSKTKYLIPNIVTAL